MFTVSTRLDLFQVEVAIGRETRSFEVKGPGDLRDRAYRARVARAAMSLGNLRDGGVLCLGIDDKTIAEMQPGLDQAQCEAWSHHDNVSDALARYSDPPVSFSLHPITPDNGNDVVVIDISEFELSPHICRQDQGDALQQGMVYVRPRRKPESVPVPTATDMRDLLDLAITKGVRDFIRRAVAAGVPLQPTVPPESLDRAAFAAEAEQAWSESSGTLELIASSAHFDLAIRPSPFTAERVPPEELEPFITQNTVRLRGWPLPYINPREPIQRYGTWIGQDFEPERVPHREAWRFCGSGQFLQRRVLATELRPNSSPELSPTHPAATGVVIVWDIVLYLVEVAELASRIATLDSSTTTIDVTLHKIAGRELISGDWNRELHGPYLIAADTLHVSGSITTAELIANPRQTGVHIAQQLLRQFGADLPDQVLIDWHEDILKNR
jgi:hypothetical protein